MDRNGKQFDLNRLAHEPIAVPGHPFWIVFKRFGRDEAIAAVVNILATVVASCFYSNIIVLALAGPIVEKIGFFPAHFWEAVGVYRTTAVQHRKKLSSYLKHAFANGSISLVEDVLIHDPCYTLLMILGLRTYPGVPIWLLAATSFVVAVVIVSLFETSATELRYVLLKNKLRRSGFGSESYYESRFMISNTGRDPKDVIVDLANEFKMASPKRMEYHDLYLEHQMKSYSGRKPKVRLRDRTLGESERLCSLQVVYTRPSEVIPRRFDQYRFFPIRKEKMYFPIEIGGLDKEKHSKISNFKTIKEVLFTRFVAHNKKLLISVDVVWEGREFYILELKTHKDIKVMMAAMRWVMETLPVVQTTHGKSELLGVVN